MSSLILTITGSAEIPTGPGHSEEFCPLPDSELVAVESIHILPISALLDHLASILLFSWRRVIQAKPSTAHDLSFASEGRRHGMTGVPYLSTGLKLELLPVSARLLSHRSDASLKLTLLADLRCRREFRTCSSHVGGLPHSFLHQWSVRVDEITGHGLTCPLLDHGVIMTGHRRANDVVSS